MNGAESHVMVVAGILTMFYRIIPTAVSEGPAGTATRNYVARDSDGTRWFVKAYPAGTDLDAERQALELGQFARLGPIPVPMVRQTLGLSPTANSKRKQMITGDLVSAAALASVPVTAIAATSWLTSLNTGRQRRWLIQ